MRSHLASRKLFVLFLAVMGLSVASCAEPAGSGTKVALPKVYINCATNKCKTYSGARKTFVYFTTSGCSQPDFGMAVSGSSTSISCNATSGCSGEIFSWIDTNGATTTIPSGTYSICAYIAHDGKDPDMSTDITKSARDNVLIDVGVADQTFTTWTPSP